MVVRGAPTEVVWETCATEATCNGARVGPGGECLAHVDVPSLQTIVAGGAEGVALDGRGVRFTQSLLERVLACAAVDDGQRSLGGVRFDGATFDHDAVFDAVSFEGEASFAGTVFKRGARFGGAAFGGSADFAGVIFSGQAWFVGATFAGPASFVGATFAGPAWLRQARFSTEASFAETVFDDDVIATSAVFAGPASFANATFKLRTRFERCDFAVEPLVDGARVLMEGQSLPVGAESVPSSGEDAPVRPVPGREPRPPRRHRRRLRIRSYMVPVLAVALLAGLSAYVLRPEKTAPDYRPRSFGDESAFAFLFSNQTTRLPARYNPCEPIRYVVNPQLGPSDWKGVVEEAIAALSAASGMTFVNEGTTAEIVKPTVDTDPMAPDTPLNETQRGDTAQVAESYQQLFHRPSYQPDRYGKDRWAPILIEWVDLEERVRQEIGGIGMSEPRDIDGKTVYVSGIAIVNTNIPRAQLKRALMHELGHVVGLAHVEDNFAVMFPVGRTGLPRYSAGDVAGLQKVGQQAGCLPVPPPGP